MGGKALNKYGVTTERKSTKDFHKIANYIQEKIGNDLELLTHVVKCYHRKDSHGDLDLLIQIDVDYNINWRNYIEFTFKPKAIHNNGGVYSFDYEEFQIDFIPVKKSKWETAKVYYSYDPLGNCMGKTFHKFNLSYGWDGLYYKFRNFNGRLAENILITNDPRKIFEFGGYDYDRYLQGFDDLDDIFKFVIDGKYFDTNVFKFENLNQIDRKRNRKRNTYHLFLGYIELLGDVKYPFHKDKDLYIPMIEEFFPEARLMEKLKELELLDKQNKILSQKFNGDIVMAWLPDLKGKELGHAINKFKFHLGNEYDDFIFNASYVEIYNRFMDIYENYE